MMRFPRPAAAVALALAALCCGGPKPPARPVVALVMKSLANEFFQTDSIAVTVLGNLNGLKLTREQLVC